MISDLVWIQVPTPQIDNTPITHKLRPKFQGPCRLVQQLSPSTFIAVRLSDNVSLGSTNIDRIKPYYEPQPMSNSESLISDSSSCSTARCYPLRNRRPSLNR